MTQLQFHNSLSRRKEPFRPIRPGRVSIYLCGVTVYDHCHLGHARMLIVFDVLVRLLRALGWRVHFVRNITDVDDKIIRRSRERGCDWRQLVAQYTDSMHQDAAALGTLPPDEEPRATDYMEQIIAMIERLRASGHAYTTDAGDVYYRTASFAGYGLLSGNRLQDMLAGARVEAEPGKEAAADFALWKAAPDDEPGWASPFGRGRPGWHIECSAMSRACIGRSVDIHGGGADLIFPHHENEIAQSEAANGCRFVNYWLHFGPVRVSGADMSKSLGNSTRIADILRKYHPEVLRWLLIGSHYRSHIDYSDAALQAAASGLGRVYECLRRHPLPDAPMSLGRVRRFAAGRRFVDAMADDMGSPQALAELAALVRAVNTASGARARRLHALLHSLGAMLGLFQGDANARMSLGHDRQLGRERIEQLLAERQEARRAGDYGRADAIRQQLAAGGVAIKDGPEGSSWHWL